MSEREVVGHKTFDDGHGGHYHEPLYADEAKALMEALDRRDKARAALMPDEKSAHSMLFEAWQRLKELGWSEAIYCPKDGTVFDAIEAGTTGVFPCHYEGEWPNGSWWAYDGGELWPSHPILFKLKQST